MLQAILEAIDSRHRMDPNQREIQYAERMTSWMYKLIQEPSAELQVAVRAQHFERWRYPRSAFPLGRLGYLAWRQDTMQRQATALEELLQSLNCDGGTIDRVLPLVKKQGIESDADVQCLEDCACLVFLENELSRFIQSHKDDLKTVRVVRKTMLKMSDQAKYILKNLRTDGKAAVLIERVLGEKRGD